MSFSFDPYSLVSCGCFVIRFPIVFVVCSKKGLRITLVPRKADNSLSSNISVVQMLWQNVEPTLQSNLHTHCVLPRELSRAGNVPEVDNNVEN